MATAGGVTGQQLAAIADYCLGRESFTYGPIDGQKLWCPLDTTGPNAHDCDGLYIVIDFERTPQGTWSNYGTAVPFDENDPGHAAAAALAPCAPVPYYHHT